jgi:hypothetical protein
MKQLSIVVLLSLCFICVCRATYVHTWKDHPSELQVVKTSGKLKIGNNGEYHLQFSLNSEEIDCVSSHVKEEVLQHASESSLTREKMMKVVGPDEIFVEVGGKTLQSFLATYNGCRSYSVQFHIPISGAYHMNVVFLRSDYAAVNEVEKSFPLFEYDTLFQDWLWLDANNVTETERQKCPYAPTQGIWTVRPENSDLVRGVFDNLAMAKESPTFVLDKPGANATMPFYLNLTNPREGCVNVVNQYHWDSSACGHPFIHHKEASTLVTNKHILFSGDSQMRTFAVNFFHFVCNIGVPHNFNQKTPSFHIPKNSPTCKGLNMRYINNGYCKINELPEGSNVDLLIANCGHHPASGTGAQYPLQKYIDLLENFTLALPGKGYSPKNVVWLENVPLPLRKDSVVIEVCDWRTPDRIRLYNSQANPIMSNAGYKVIPFFEPMMPLMNKICDIAHYTTQHSNDPGIQPVLRLFHEMSSAAGPQ